MGFFRKHYLVLIGVTIGAGAGYIYYSTIGCVSGNCPITSQPVNSTLYGALMGGLLSASFKKNK